MSGLSLNSLTLYLRPTEALQPYQINNCARWLVEQGKFAEYHQARNWLFVMEETQPFRFKAVMSKYYEATEYTQDYKSKRDVNQYQSTKNNSYGEDSHMWWSAKLT